MLLEKLQTICTRFPDRTAVTASDSRLTYGELDQRSTALARYLVTSRLAEGTVVAIHMRRTANALVALVGIMKAGGAYTVVEDDGHPAEHLTRLKSIEPGLVLCEAAQLPLLQGQGLPVLCIDEALRAASHAPMPARRQSSDPAYVLFTSGSTGKPKGVVVTHGNIAHYTGAVSRLLSIDAPLRYAHVSTLAADLGNTSLFLSLWSGGGLHLIDTSMRRDPAALRDYLLRHDIQFLKITPSHWNAIFASMGPQHLQALRLHYLVLGGELLPVSLARRIIDSGAVRVLLNHYGPTETTVGVSTFPFFDPGRLDTIKGDSVPIGTPLGETELRVRTDAGQFRDKSARGELYIGGPSVAAGYLNDAVATARGFVTLDVPNARGRFYKTGDQVEIDDNGVVYFLGRIDRQVKVNGYRVELEHVESVLRTAPGVAEAAAFFLEVRGKQRIVAAVATRGGEDGFEGLKRYLSGVVPEYMIPSLFVRLEQFPRNENGKTDLKQLQGLLVEHIAGLEAGQSESAPPPEESADPADAQLIADIRRAWATYLHGQRFSNTDRFFELGGDSLDAIQLIAGLQLRGHPVTARGFLAEPTVEGLVRMVRQRARIADPVPSTAHSLQESHSLSPAQDFFFHQQLVDPDHYNQALLLECGTPVDPNILRQVLLKLAEGHSQLRTAYVEDEHGVQARVVQPDVYSLLDVSFTPSRATEQALESHIERTAQRIQESLSLRKGRLFRAHLFKLEEGRDQLLLVAHHVAVDVISWRILMSELVRLYNALRAGDTAGLPACRSGFWGWVQHLHTHEDRLYAQADSWLTHTAEQLGQTRRPTGDAGTEGGARTLWLGFSRQETRLLLRELVGQMNAPFHQIMLAAFARALASSRGESQLAIDVESHGRVTLDESVDVSRVVGWHTSTYPLVVHAASHLAATLQSVTDEMARLPDLGVAYGLRNQANGRGQRARTSADICFNYLGELNFNHDERFTLTPSRHSIGRARGDRNHRGHSLKMTVRVVEGHLVADLSFPGHEDPERMAALMREVQRDLLAPLGQEVVSPSMVMEAGTRTGLLSYVPRQLFLEPVPATLARRDYSTVLLTGANGYVGSHVLRELFRQSAARVVCLVRGKDGQSAYERLRSSFDWYFPDMPLSDFEERCMVLECDITHERFGLPAATYEQLAGTVDAIYHFAADCRLFGPEEDFRRHNVVPVQTCIDFAMRGQPKDLHYMSTLAVCGVNKGERPVEFSEESANVGQEFQNDYEASKYLAESLVQRFEVAGGRGFIYRSGNVSGHSVTGRFQRNARDNRLVQFLASCVKIGRLPRALGEPVVLSPVDEVAAGIVAISLDADSRGGVYHVDGTQQIGMERLFEALHEAGIAFERTTDHDFASLFGSVRDSKDVDLALGYFWSTRQPRNVRFNHERTHQVLRRLGCTFRPLDKAWVSRFVHSLVEAGVFDLGNRAAAHACERTC